VEGRTNIIQTDGLPLIALAVQDPERSARFYQDVLGAQVVYASDDLVQVQTPGSRDVLVFERAKTGVGVRGGVAHFGFRLVDPGDIALAAQVVERAGGTVRERGEFVPGEPYLFATDLDGYEIEIWYEIPTPVDPPAPAARSGG
jgi:catechol 2,3-dioxygenase-like lactoylglutathione lyase family enzyme